LAAFGWKLPEEQPFDKLRANEAVLKQLNTRELEQCKAKEGEEAEFTSGK
jgi:hypothetical protein